MFQRTLSAVFGERMIEFLSSIIPGGFTLLLFLILALWLKSMLVVTPQQHVRLLETFGRYTGYRSAGLSLKRSEEHTSELQSLMRISYAVFCLQKKNKKTYLHHYHTKS